MSNAMLEECDQSLEMDSIIFSFFFRLVMWWRVFYGSAQLLLGLTLLKWAVVDPARLLHQLLARETTHRSIELFLRLIGPLVEHLSSGTVLFIALHFVFWGLADVILSISILQHKLWAFPVTIFSIALFVLYEIYRVWHTHSIVLMVVIGIDIFIMWLVAREYQYLRKKLTKGVSSAS